MQSTSLDTDNSIFSPTPRSFAQHNLSNPSIPWGGKFEGHCTLGLATTSLNFLIGDSHIERLSRPSLLSLSQAKLPGWINCGIGGDRAQHVFWRILHGGTPSNPGKSIISMGLITFDQTTKRHVIILPIPSYPQLATY